MTFLQKLLGQTSSLDPAEERFWNAQYGAVAASGIRVTEDGALNISAAWACGRLISETVAMLPRIIYRRLGQDGEDGKERAVGHELYNLLHNSPNRRQTAFEFVDMLQMHALFRGNGYAKIISSPDGAQVEKLIPVHPSRVQVEEVDDDTLRYRITERNGSQKVYNDDEIFHLRGLSLDGITGVSVVTYARESFGLTLAAERFGAKLFANYSRPGGFLKHPGHLSEQAQERLAAQTERMTSGENIHRLGVLEEGMDYVQVTLSPEDSQMLQTREFQAEDVCRWFRVPPHMVGLTSKATSWGSGIEELSRGFVTFVLLPWLIRWQQLIGKDLILDSEEYFVEFLTEALLRGDLTKRYNAYAIGRQSGWLATNEVRRLENMNPIKGGDDDYLTPMNMRESGDDPAAAPAQDGTKEPLQDRPAEPGTEDDGQGAHYKRLLMESAARVVRKEIAAMTRAAKRTDGDRAAWRTAVEEFYADHEDFVAQAMQMRQELAVHYCTLRTMALVDQGISALVKLDNQLVDDLVALAMEDL